MRRILPIFVLLLACAALKAQSPQIDSLLGSDRVRVSASLEGKNIFEVMPSNVKVIKSEATDSAFVRQAAKNVRRMYNGYRIRLFSDNRQNARSAAEDCVRRFKASFPGTAVYMVYNNPFFIVSAGDFRTKLNAEAAIVEIKKEFPDAAIIRERIKFPD